MIKIGKINLNLSNLLSATNQVQIITFLKKEFLQLYLNAQCRPFIVWQFYKTDSSFRIRCYVSELIYNSNQHMSKPIYFQSASIYNPSFDLTSSIVIWFRHPFLFRLDEARFEMLNPYWMPISFPSYQRPIRCVYNWNKTMSRANRTQIPKKQAKLFYTLTCSNSMNRCIFIVDSSLLYIYNFI